MTDRVDPRIERTRHDVHEAVLALLRQDGLRAITHTRVAERSGVSRATLYRHWPDRPSLLVSTLEALRPQLDLPAATGDLGADARALLRAVAAHLNGNDMLVDLLVLLREAEQDPEYAVAQQHLLPTEGNPVLELVLAAQARGAIAADLDPRAAALGLLGPMLATRVLLRQEITDELIDGVVAVWLDGVRCR